MAKRSTSPDWDIDNLEIPRSGAPDADRLARRQKWQRRYFMTAAVTLPLVLIMSLLALSNGHKSTGTGGSNNSAAASSPGRTAATLELSQWLSSTPAPLPNAKMLSWDGATPIPAVVVPKQSNAQASSTPPTWSAELDHFTLLQSVTTTDASGTSTTQQTLYAAAIEVAIDPRGGAQAVSGPSLIQEAPTATDGWYQGGPWPGVQSSSTVSSPVQNAINGWVTAYTSGNSEQLGLSVGDPNGSHGYLPLSNVSSASASVTAASPQPGGANGAEMVQVQLSIQWNGQKAVAQGQSSSGPATTMDLLVERSNTAAPVVVAWGPPGTGPTLQPYGNAISTTGRTLPSASTTTTTTASS